MAITFDGQNDRITTSSQSLTVPSNVAGTFQAGGLAIGAGSTVLTTNTAGNVGVGTISAVARLHVNESSWPAAVIAPSVSTVNSDKVGAARSFYVYVDREPTASVWSDSSNRDRFFYNSLYVRTPVRDGVNNPAIVIAENGGQATGRNSLVFWNGDYNTGEGYIKSRIYTQVGASYNATEFFIDVADSSRNLQNRFRIDTSGRILMPNQPAFYVVHTATSGTNQQNTTVILTAPIINRGSAYSTSTGRYTCPVTGLYQFFFGTIKSDNGVAPDGRVSRFNIRKNGTNVSTELRLSENGGYGESASLVCLVECAANDFIDVYITDTGGWYGNTYAHFGGFLIG